MLTASVHRMLHLNSQMTMWHLIIGTKQMATWMENAKEHAVYSTKIRKHGLTHVVYSRSSAWNCIHLKNLKTCVLENWFKGNRSHLGDQTALILQARLLRMQITTVHGTKKECIGPYCSKKNGTTRVGFFGCLVGKKYTCLESGLNFVWLLMIFCIVCVCVSLIIVFKEDAPVLVNGILSLPLIPNFPS